MIVLDDKKKDVFIYFIDDFYSELKSFLDKQSLLQFDEKLIPVLPPVGNLIHLIKQKKYKSDFIENSIKESIEIDFFEFKDTEEHTKDHFDRHVRDKWDRTFFKMIRSNQDPHVDNDWNKHYRSLRIKFRVEKTIQEESEEKSFLFFSKKIQIEKNIKNAFYCYPLSSESYNPCDFKSIVIDYDCIEPFNIGDNLGLIELKKQINHKQHLTLIEDLELFVEQWNMAYLQKMIETNRKVFEDYNILDEQLKKCKSLSNSLAEFRLYVSNNQDIIQETNISIIKNLVQIQSFLKTKIELINILNENLKKIDFNEMESNSDEFYSREEIILMVDQLKHEYASFEVSFFSALAMVKAIINKDALTYFEIYDVFEKNNTFISTWELGVSTHFEELKETIIAGFSKIENEIQNLDKNLTRSLANLSFINGDYIQRFGEEIGTELKEIKSSIRFNNLIQVIDLYRSN